MTIKFNDNDSESDRLDRLLAKATELEHPGIDPEGIETMRGFIESGRFPHSHYIKMWTKRLEDMGVKISTGQPATEVTRCRYTELLGDLVVVGLEGEGGRVRLPRLVEHAERHQRGGHARVALGKVLREGERL